MNESERTSLRVFIGLEIACFIGLLFGVLTTCSPFWTPGGLLGWWEGYNAQEDVLGIVWLGGSLLSIFLGIIITIAAAAMGIWFGIGAGIVGLASKRARREPGKTADEAKLGVTGAATNGRPEQNGELSSPGSVQPEKA